MPAQTWLVDIAPERCIELLERATLGRLAVVASGRPEIFPVNHVWDRTTNSVSFPTRPGTKLNGILTWPFVAFEVDGVDADEGGGWSVEVVGTPAEIVGTEEIARLTAQRDIPWALGRSVRWIRIISSQITGRRISAVDSA